MYFQLGLVCFRLKNDSSNRLNKKLLELINESGKVHMVPATIHGKFVIRFCVVAQHSTESDMGELQFSIRIEIKIIIKAIKSHRNISEYAWKVIKELSAEILYTEGEQIIERNEVRKLS